MVVFGAAKGEYGDDYKGGEVLFSQPLLGAQVSSFAFGSKGKEEL